jgi:TusA-related sulfurtransferase
MLSPIERGDSMAEVVSPEVPRPQSVLEAGSEASAVLLRAMSRRIDELASGQVLEVESRRPSSAMDAIAWCHVTGHELVALVSVEGKVRLWIRKREAG